jgi:hypothetical protein
MTSQTTITKRNRNLSYTSPTGTARGGYRAVSEAFRADQRIYGGSHFNCEIAVGGVRVMKPACRVVSDLDCDGFSDVVLDHGQDYGICGR